ncbi:MAG: hypothetical protein JWN46_1521 [Acidimicrobiales bacterium]|nr:hypothetical protein [Acidimicrobiales bacterium]
MASPVWPLSDRSLRPEADPIIWVWLTLACDHASDLGDLTPLLGVQPTKVWTKGDPTLVRGRLCTSSGWQRQFGPRQTLDLRGMIEKLLDLLELPSEAFVRLTDERGLEAEVSVHIHMAQQTPVGTLDAELIRRIAALGASLDLDLYTDLDEELIARYLAKADEPWSPRGESNS